MGVGPDGLLDMKRYGVVHVELSEANQFVAQHHRHHKPARGHRFSLGAIDRSQGGVVAGVAIVGRPVGRMVDQRWCLEILRLCVVQGFDNACSFLLGAVFRAAEALGYREVWTYTLEGESGSSLKAVGMTRDGVVRRNGKGWSSRPGRDEEHPDRKVRWRMILSNGHERQGGLTWTP